MGLGRDAYVRRIVLRRFILSSFPALSDPTPDVRTREME